MARPDNLESRPIIRRVRSAGGHIRALPNLGASGSELSNGHVNGQFNPDADVTDIKTYLLNPDVYGFRGHLSFFERSRNNRHSRRF